MTQGGKTDIRQKGFTIIEVLIVLAVTGFLLSMAILFINGRQNRTEFQVGIRDIQQSFQQVINGVATGFYPDVGNVRCTASASAPLPITSAATSQGQNQGCIFMGKVLTAGSSRSNTVGIFALAGRRLDGSLRDVTSPFTANPTAIAPGIAANTTAPNLTESFKLPNGITFKYASVRLAGAGAWSANLPAGSGNFGLAVVSSLANFSNPVASEQGSTQRLEMYQLHSPKWGVVTNEPTEVDAINDEMTATMGNKWTLKLDQARYCFASGGTRQSGLITIGSGGGGLTVTLDMKNGTTCA